MFFVKVYTHDLRKREYRSTMKNYHQGRFWNTPQNTIQYNTIQYIQYNT